MKTPRSARLIGASQDEQEEDEKLPSIPRRPAGTGGQEETRPAKKQKVDILVLSSDEEEDDVGILVACRTREQRQEWAKVEQERRDAELAASLQESEVEERDKRQRQEMAAMQKTPSGRAVLLAENVIQLLQKHNEDGIEPLGKDDAVFLAEQMLELQTTVLRDRKLKGKGKVGRVTIGYHFTNVKNLDSIRTDGLLTIADRIAVNHSNTQNRAAFGDGIYTANNPHGFAHFGEVGLLVAILEGGKQTMVVGNKFGNDYSPFLDELILKKSTQVLPLVKFPTSRLTNPSFVERLWSIHTEIQHQILDNYFNRSLKTQLHRCLPVAVNCHNSAAVPGTTLTAVYRAPPSLVGSTSIAFRPAKSRRGDCPICFTSLTGGRKTVIRLPHCNHEYHRQCIEASVKHDLKCSKCRTPIINTLQGRSPSGSMTVTTSSADVFGFKQKGSIIICYNMQAGTQMPYHPNPGVRYGNTARKAYLPNVPAGVALTKRLIHAFQHGLTFTIGTCLTTGKPDCVTWSTIHHKTSMCGGAHGWPDLNYFKNASAELDTLGVPQACNI